MMTKEPSSRRYAHSEGNTHLKFDENRHLVTCGHDCDVRIFTGIEEDDSLEFTVTTETISAIVPYKQDGREMVAVATDNHSVQAFTQQGSPDGLLMRFTSPVTYLDVDHTHCRLAASSCDFTIRLIQLDDITQVSWLRGHQAPVLCALFDPRGNYLVSTSCDGSIRIWDLENGNVCIKQLHGLHKCSDVSLAKSLAYVSWQPNGKLLAVPMETEVKVYESGSWECVATLKHDCHKVAINVVSWKGCGQYLACGGVDGVISIWYYPTHTLIDRYCNESGIGITSLEWYPDTATELEQDSDKRGLYFADKEGYIGWFQGAWPETRKEVKENDPLADDSLLMEGIPPDAIFGTDDVIDDDDRLLDGNDDGLAQSGSHGNSRQVSEECDDEILKSRKRRRLLDDSDEENTVVPPDDGDSLVSGDTGSAPSRQMAPPTSRGVFNEKQLEVYQHPILPSSTPHTLTHHFLVYNMVGVVRSHSDDDTAMIEVEFHNTTIHHSFSIPNHHGNSMASLNETCLVLACQRDEFNPSQLQCVHFSCWDASNRDWSIPLPSKESATALSLGNGWIAMATDKQLLRIFSLGGMQCDVISVAGVIVGVAGWGSRLAVIYQEAPCTENVFQLRVWVLDIKKRKQLSPPHSLPLSLHSKLEWFGFSEGGCFLTYDTKGIVRLLDSAHYGGLSWIPILDMTKQVGNKSDHFVMVGMTHNPDEIRAILCKGLKYPPVQPKPVMTVLPLQLPLCQPTTEQTQLEDKFLQGMLLRKDVVARAQSLMKMFALACKADHNFLALEVAALMEDEMTLNLALTYASRTQHHILARHISDLISNFSCDDVRGGEDENLTNSETEDIEYMESRSSVLKQRVQSRDGTSNGASGSKRVGSSLRIKTTSKFEPNSENRTRAKFLNNANPSMATGGKETGEGSGALYDETKELFSDEGEGDGEGEGERGEGEGEEGERTPVSTPLPGTKRPNPFKMTTPECRQIQSDRKSSFLDNIGERTQHEEQLKEQELKRRRERGVGVRGGGGRRKKSAPVAKKLQTNLLMKKTSSLAKTKTTNHNTDSGQNSGDN